MIAGDLRMASGYVHVVMPSPSPIRDYHRGDYERITTAIEVEAEVVARLSDQFNTAAMWYRINKRQPKRISPSVLQKRLTQISGHALKLLKARGFNDPANAIDGPSHTAVLEALVNRSGPDETDVLKAADRIARISEICSGINAACDLHMWATATEERALTVRKAITPSGHRGDDALNEWIATMMSTYEQLTGSLAATSTIAPGQTDAGKASGPLIRFLEAAASPIGVEMSADAWSARVKAIRKHSASQK